MTHVLPPRARYGAVVFIRVLMHLLADDEPVKSSCGANRARHAIA